MPVVDRRQKFEYQAGKIHEKESMDSSLYILVMERQVLPHLTRSHVKQR